MKISVIGLGKLGLPLAATIASKGFFVYGVDINKKVVDDLNKGKTNLKETKLQNLIKRFKNKIQASDNGLREAVLNSDISFIITPTPSKANGQFSLKHVTKVVKEIAKALKIKGEYHLVILVSTVMPGSTDKIKKILENGSGKICGKDFGLCYNPEFIALGSVIYNLLNPDLILIGESDQKSGDILQKFYKKYCNNKPKIARMNFVNAELAKISVNTYVTTKISYANMLSEICEKLPGGNVDVVTQALGMDSRITPKFFKGGPSFGGPCFPRDNMAFIALTKKLKSNYSIALSTHKTNIRQTQRVIDLIINLVKNKSSRIGILGLSYKPDTDVIEESQGLLIAKELIKQGLKPNLYDPLSLDNVKKTLENKARYFNKLEECIKNSQILIIATSYSEFGKIKKEWLKNCEAIIDLWRILDRSSISDNIRYIPLGVNINF